MIVYVMKENSIQAMDESKRKICVYFSKTKHSSRPYNNIVMHVDTVLLHILVAVNPTTQYINEDSTWFAPYTAQVKYQLNEVIWTWPIKMLVCQAENWYRNVAVFPTIKIPPNHIHWKFLIQHSRAGEMSNDNQIISRGKLLGVRNLFKPLKWLNNFASNVRKLHVLNIYR